MLSTSASSHDNGCPCASGNPTLAHRWVAAEEASANPRITTRYPPRVKPGRAPEPTSPSSNREQRAGPTERQPLSHSTLR